MNIRKLKSSELDAAMYAIILGDGCIQKSGGNFTSGSNYVFQMGHCEKQREYLLWKRDIIDQVGSVKTSIRDYEKTNSVYLRTNARKYFTKLEKVFYIDRKKTINKKILTKMNVLSLAIWFMDDGYVSANKSGSVYGELCTDQFSLEQVTQIQSWFISKFSMNVGIRELRYKSGKNSGKVAYRIKFNKENCSKLKSLIGQYVNQIDCMKYKLSKIK